MTTALPLPETARIPGFDSNARVWVYVCARALSPEETAFVHQQLQHFVRQWTAHDQALKAHAELFENQFVVLCVDETQAGASGCSIDKSVHFLENLGTLLHVDFFERMLFFFLNENGKIQSANKAAFARLVQEGVIQEDTPVLNQLVQNLSDLQNKWWLPFQDSWHKKLI